MATALIMHAELVGLLKKKMMKYGDKNHEIVCEQILVWIIGGRYGFFGHVDS